MYCANVRRKEYLFVSVCAGLPTGVARGLGKLGEPPPPPPHLRTLPQQQQHFENNPLLPPTTLRFATDPNLGNQVVPK